MCTETATFLCEDGIEREFELRFIFEHLDKTYAVLFQKLSGSWEMDGEVFLVDMDEETGAENNFTVMEYLPPDHYSKPIIYREIEPDIREEVLEHAEELINTGGYSPDGIFDDDMPF